MEIKLNLSSRPYLNRQSIRLWLLFASVLMVMLLLFNVTYAYQNYNQLQFLDARFAELEEKAFGMSGAPAGYSPENLSVVKSEIALANDIVSSDQFLWTSLLDRFEDLVPAGVRITSIQPNFSQKSLQLACVAKDVSAMTEFMDNLLASEDMSQVFLKSHGEVESQRDGFRQSQVTFSLDIKEAF